MTNEEFLERALIVNDSRYDILGTFDGWRSKVDIRCKKCSTVRSVRVDAILKGVNCPSCNAVKYKEAYTKSTETYKSEVLDRSYGKYELVGDYNGVNTYTYFKHLDCGTTYKAKPFQFNRGRRCPNCKNSKGEVAIANYLNSIHLEYEEQATSRVLPNLKYRHSYDFYIPSLNVLIEYQGIQHYHPVESFGGMDNLIRQQNSDKYKREFATNNGYSLVEIPYTENTSTKISSFLENALSNIVNN